MGIAADNTNTDELGHIAEAFPEATVEVIAVIAEQTSNADAEWNIEVEGTAVFSSEQSVSSSDTPELFVPDQNEFSATETDQLNINKSSQASASDSLHVTVVTDDGR
jgi:hypothetical protein